MYTFIRIAYDGEKETKVRHLMMKTRICPVDTTTTVLLNRFGACRFYLPLVMNYHSKNKSRQMSN